MHNTQPWRFTLGPDTVELFADRSRQLPMIDPDGREMLISCGAALFNVVVALTTDGYRPSVERLPETARPDLLARVRADDDNTAHPSDERGLDSPARGLAELDRYVIRRQTNRRRFTDDAVPAALIERVRDAARACGATVLPIGHRHDRLMVAELARTADQRQILDPAYRAELRQWTGNQPHRRDGVPALAVPHVAAGTPGDLPMRDFDTTGSGYLPVDTGTTSDQCLLVLGTVTDTPLAWLHAGEALQHVLLEIVRHGYVASPLTQIVEDPDTRTRLHDLVHDRLGQDMVPQMLLRVGQAPPTPAAPRRRIADVLTTSD